MANVGILIVLDLPFHPGGVELLTRALVVHVVVGVEARARLVRIFLALGLGPAKICGRTCHVILISLLVVRLTTG